MENFTKKEIDKRTNDIKDYCMERWWADVPSQIDEDILLDD